MQRIGLATFCRLVGCLQHSRDVCGTLENTWKHQITGAMTKFLTSFVSAASIQSLTATQKTKPSSFCRTCTCSFFGFIHHVEVYLVFSCGWGEVAGCHPLVPVCSSAAFQWQFTGYTIHDPCIYLSLLEAGGTMSYNRLSSKWLCKYIVIDVPWGGHAGVIVLRLHIWCGNHVAVDMFQPFRWLI